MNRPRLINEFKPLVIDLDVRLKYDWDGVFHGDKDPNGGIGPGRSTDISNGF